MITARLERAGTVLRVRLPDPLAPAFARLRHYRTLPPTGDADHTVTVTAASHPGFDYQDTATLFAVPPAELTPGGLQVVIDQGFHRALDRLGRAVLHASAVSDGRQVWALWGSSGAGKTTLALAVHRAAGWSVVSNGSLVVGLVGDEPHVFGTAKRHVKLRASSLRTPAAIPDGSGPDGSGTGGAPTDAGGSRSAGYEDKREVDLAVLGADSVRLPLPLERLHFVRLVAALPDALTTRLDPRRTAVQLHEDIVRHLHGGEAVVFGRDGRLLAPVPSAASEAGHRARVALIAALTARATTLTGPLDACLRLLDPAPLPGAPTMADPDVGGSR